MQTINSDFNVIIQARMGSKRFPGKSMFLFNGYPVIHHLIESLLQLFKKQNLIIATSALPENTPIRQFCKSKQIEVYSGSEENVALRFFHINSTKNNKFFIHTDNIS